jgi:hypothetical protein
VSEHLHEWIDLIFGYKQRGKAAIDAYNVFIHITYEDEIDLDAIDDPIIKSATLSQINNFGQTPTKIFTKIHPKKMIPEVVKRLSDGTILVEPTALSWHNHLAPPLTVVGASKFTILKCVSSGQVSVVYSWIFWLFIRFSFFCLFVSSLAAFFSLISCCISVSCPITPSPSHCLLDSFFRLSLSTVGELSGNGVKEV